MRNATDELDDTFLVISGDVLTDIDLGAFVEAHQATAARSASIALKRVENPLEFGIVITRDDGIDRAVPREADVGRGVLRHDQHRHLRARARRSSTTSRAGEVVDFSGDVFPARARRRAAAATGTSSTATGRTSARSRPTSARTRTCSTAASQVDIDGFRLGDGVWLGEGADVDPDAAHRGPGRHRRQLPHRGGRARCGEYTVLGTDVVVKADAVPRARGRATTTSTSGRGARLRGCGDRPVDRPPRRTPASRRASCVGDECFVGEHAVINPGVKIYPFKTVEAGAVVNSSIVWESRGARTLFGRRGVRGLANVDITPEVAVRVAMAYGTALKKGAVVTTSRDTSRVGPRAEAGGHRRR